MPGCPTHSNHHKVKRLIRVAESLCKAQERELLRQGMSGPRCARRDRAGTVFWSPRLQGHGGWPMLAMREASRPGELRVRVWSAQLQCSQLHVCESWFLNQWLGPQLPVSSWSFYHSGYQSHRMVSKGNALSEASMQVGCREGSNFLLFSTRPHICSFYTQVHKMQRNGSCFPMLNMHK